MTDEYNDFPTEANRLIMEMARGNVVLAADKFSERIANMWQSLSTSSKRVLPFA